MKVSRDYINLLPAEEKKSARTVSAAMLFVSLVALAWFVAFGRQARNVWEVKKQMAPLAAKRQLLQQELESIYKKLGLAVPAGTNPEKAALIHTLLGERVLWSEVFKQFSRIVPKGLWFDNLEGSTAGRAEIRIKGGAFNYLSVAEFMLAMEKTAYFERPQLLYARKTVVQGQDVIGFEIVCDIIKAQGVR